VLVRPIGGEVLDPTKNYTVKWDASQLFFFDGHGMNHQGSVVPTKKVQISLVGTLAESTCIEEGLSAEQNCEETILIGDNVLNTGSFTFDFSKNADAMESSVHPWADRHLSLRVKISASDHSLTTHVSQDSFSFGRSPSSSGSKCFTSGHQSEEITSAIPFGPKVRRIAKADRRLGGTEGTLSTGYSLGLEANFKSVALTLIGSTYTLWQDANTASPGKKNKVCQCMQVSSVQTYANFLLRLLISAL